MAFDNGKIGMKMQTKNIVFTVSFMILSLSISAASALDHKEIEVKERKVEDIPKDTPAQEAVKQSNQWANDKKAMPIPGDDGRIIFTYGRSVPTVICAPLHVCDVELEAGEVVQDVDIGDKVRWSLTPAISGVGDNKTVHVIIKPKDFDLDTNAVIATDKRIYYLRLISKQAEYVTRIAFFYPENQKRAWEAEKLAMQKKEALVTADLPPLSVDALNFEYASQIISGVGRFKPVRVFDDKSKVYIQMPENMRTNEAPAFLILGHNGKEELVNYRVKNGYYIIDTLFDKGVLISGVANSQEKIMITRCNRRGYFGGCYAS